MEVLLELVRHEEVPREGVTQQEVVAGAKSLASGGLDGALEAINRTIAHEGFELRRAHRTGAVFVEPEPVTLGQVEQALEEGWPTPPLDAPPLPDDA